MERGRNWTPWILLIVLVVLNFTDGILSDPLGWLVGILEMIPGIIIGLTCHEFGHAAIAYRLGDSTPKMQGRVSLNPLRHIDPMGMVALFLAGFGWGKPVEVNPYNFRNRRRDGLLVDVAGVFMNLVVAVVFAFVLRFMVNGAYMNTAGEQVLLNIVVNIIYIDIVLMIFNLLPIPPLDGFGIVTELFNLRGTSFYNTVYDKGFLILLVLIVFNVTDKILTPLVGGAWDLLLNLIVY